MNYGTSKIDKFCIQIEQIKNNCSISMTIKVGKGSANCSTNTYVPLIELVGMELKLQTSKRRMKSKNSQYLLSCQLKRSIICLLTAHGKAFWDHDVEISFCFLLQSYFYLLIKHLFFPAGLVYLSNYIMAFPLRAPSSYLYCTFSLLLLLFNIYLFFNKLRGSWLEFVILQWCRVMTEGSSFIRSCTIYSTCLGIHAMLKVCLLILVATLLGCL